MATLYEDTLRALAEYLGLGTGEHFLQTEELTIGERKVGFSFEPYDVNEPVAGDILFFSVLGTPADNRKTEVWRLLLEANCLWAGTGGGVLGLQRDSAAVVLAARLPLDGLEAAQLASGLEVFLDTAKYWAELIEGTNEARPVPDTLGLRA